MIASLLLSAALAAAPRQVVDRVAATINGEVVTLGDLVERAGAEWARVERMEPGKERTEARAAALRRAFDAVVSDRLLQEEAKALQLEVTDAQVDAAIGDIKTRNRFDDAQLEQALTEQGLTRTEFRAQIRRELETYQVLQYKVRGRVKLSDDDVRNYYQTHPQEFGGEPEVRVRHVFLPLPEEASKADEQKVRAQGEKVLARLKAGEDFAKVAREVSRGPSANDGGDLGWLRRGTIQKTLEDVAFRLEPGQVSGLVRAGPGLHVLKVEERRTGGGRKFEEVAEEIRARLFEEQVGTYRQQYIDELKRNALIDAKLPELKG
ncbi:MAG TPA: peptidylprolyl isomerase [Anaeromyxobacter sp.]|nr:peptidylprolyl isomerase [Anaeromyxobacter sp.]